MDGGWIEGATVVRAPCDGTELRAFLEEVAGIGAPAGGRVAGHQGPRAYLEHAFFERGGPGGLGRDALVWACRGGGKTFLGAVATMLDLVFKPGFEVRILGGSLQQAGRMHAHLRWLFQRPALAPLVDGRITRERVRLVNGSGCELLAQSQTAVRGTRVHTIRCDEVELFDPEVWSAAQLTTRSEAIDVPGWGPTRVGGAVEALSTMHVPYGLMFRLVKEAAAGNRALFKWGVLDVLERCGPGFACRSGRDACALWDDCGGRAKEEGQAGHVRIEDALTQLARVDRSTWESEMLCLRPSRSGTVLPEFDARRHVVTRVPEAGGALWVCGMDFGYRSPTVVLWAAVSGGVVYVVDEHVRREMVIDEHVAAMRARPWPEPSWVGVDPAGRQRSEQTGVGVSDVLRGRGYTVRDRRLPLVEGLLALRARLAPASGVPTMFVHERCAELIRSLETYHYPAEDERSLVPVKDGADHAVDALRYLVQNLDRPYRSARGRYA